MPSSSPRWSPAVARDLPATVSDAVLARVARLSPEARATLRAAAVIGVRVEPSVILRIEGWTPMALDECVAQGMLRFDPPTFVFRHELSRAAVLRDIAPTRLVELNAQALAALLAQPEDARPLARLADHAEQAGDRSATWSSPPRPPTAPPACGPIGRPPTSTDARCGWPTTCRPRTGSGCSRSGRTSATSSISCGGERRDRRGDRAAPRPRPHRAGRREPLPAVADPLVRG